MGYTTKVEEILKEYKYVQIKINNLKKTIQDIQNNIPGALKAVCYDGVKICPTNTISKMVENKAMSRQEIIDEIEIQIYALNRNNRIIDDTLKSMGQPYERIFYYKYIEELTNKHIAKELQMNEMQVSRLLTKLVDRMYKMLF